MANGLGHAAERMRALQQKIPLNDYGLPEGIYRPDLLDLTRAPSEHQRTPSTIDGATGIAVEDIQIGSASGTELYTKGELRNAFVPLAYTEGFPTMPDGRTFWMQFDFEPPQLHSAFQVYLGQPANGGEGARSLPALHATICIQPEHEGISPEVIMHWYHMYYWTWRAKAYDLFKQAALRKQIEQRAIDTQDDHFLMASRMMQRLQLYFEQTDDDGTSEFWDLMTPKVAIDLMKTIIQVQRISSGLPATGPASAAQQADAGNSFEVILRGLAKQTQVKEEIGLESQNAENLSALLSDPETAEMAQELVIRMNTK